MRKRTRGPAHPSFGMTTTQGIRDLFAWHHPMPHQNWQIETSCWKPGWGWTQYCHAVISVDVCQLVQEIWRSSSTSGQTGSKLGPSRRGGLFEICICSPVSRDSAHFQYHCTNINYRLHRRGHKTFACKSQECLCQDWYIFLHISSWYTYSRKYLLIA